MRQITPAPVRKSIVVNTDPARAFEIFTRNIGRWWPRDKTIGSSPQSDVVLEPGVGGRWYEVGQDNSQCNWGKVLVWAPPERLVLAWQIGSDWKFDPRLITEVEIRFTPEEAASGGQERTRVDLEHRGLENLGAAAERLRAAFDSDNGWAGVLRGFAQLTDPARI